MQQVKDLWQHQATDDHQQEIKRPDAQHPFYVKIPDAYGLRFKVLFKQQVGDEEPTKYEKEGNGIITIPEEAQPF
jgi:hypothetical protein